MVNLERTNAEKTVMPSPHREALTCPVTIRTSVRLAGCALAAALAFGSVPAGAAPEPAPEAHGLEVVAEQYNLARVQVDRATAVLEQTQVRIVALENEAASARNRTRSRIAAIYRRAGDASTIPLQRSTGLADIARQQKYLESAQRPDDDLIDHLRTQLRRLASEREEQAAAKVLLTERMVEARALRKRLTRLAAEAIAANAAAATTHDGAGPIAQAAAPVSASPTAAPTAPTSPPTNPATNPPPSSPPTPTPPPTPPPTPSPPPSNGAAIAVAFARAQLGKPYVFAAAGPDAFDCSGLTKAAWAAAGVRMPHYSGSQATMFTRVSWEQLQPGDIVAFYADLHHVGLYIGNGMMIHAPQTGDVVKIAPAWRTTFQWGVRPR